MGDGFSDGLFRGFIIGCMVGALAVATCACGRPSIYDEPEEQPFIEAGKRPPCAEASGAAFFLPPEVDCGEGARHWDAAVERFGAPASVWWIFGHSRDWEEWIVVGREFRWIPVAGATFDNGRIALNLGTRDWCSGALLHEFWHARTLQWGHENWPTDELESLRRELCTEAK